VLSCTLRDFLRVIEPIEQFYHEHSPPVLSLT
jgi:hypothetical protein